MRWSIAILLLALAGCSPRNPPADVAQWTCPPEWVRSVAGGCGPGVLLCTPDGGASSDACAALNLVVPHAVDDGDGGTASSFGLASDGAITGGWHEATDDGGAPSSDYNPLADQPCPTGWTRATDGTCDPALRADCPVGSAALPGGSCTHTSSDDCPTTPFADVSTEAGSATVVYVSASASSTGADGSLAHPFNTLAAGIAAAGTDGWVLVGTGRYSLSTMVTHGVHIVGTCAAHVIVDSGQHGGIVASGRAVTLDVRSIRFENAAAAVAAQNGATVRLSHASIVRPASVGVLVTGAGSVATIDDVFIDHPTLVASSPLVTGVYVQLGGSLTASHLAIVGSSRFGIACATGCRQLDVSDVVVRDSPPAADDDSTGIFFNGDPSGTPRCTVRRFVGIALHGTALSVGLPSQSTLEDIVIRGTWSRTADTARSVALSVDSGATATVSRLLLDGSNKIGIAAVDDGANLTLSHAVIRNVDPQATGLHGVALEVSGTAQVAADHLRIERSTSIGAAALGAEARLDLSDAVIVDTLPDPTAGGGCALGGNIGAHITASRVRIDRFGGIAALAVGDATSLVLRDVFITSAAPSVNDGPALYAEHGGSIDAQRVTVDSVSTMGAIANSPGSTVHLTDSCIRDVAGQPPDGNWGVCVLAQSSGVVTAWHTLLEGCHQAGVWSASQGSAVLRDVIVRHVLPSTWGFGAGVLTVSQADIDVSSVAIDDVAGLGIGSSLLPTDRPGDPIGHLTGQDLFIRNVGPSTIALQGGSTGVTPSGSPAAYGIHAAPGSSATFQRVVCDGTQFGLFNADGDLSIDTGVITHASRQAGATASAVSHLTLTNVLLSNNADDAIDMRAGLPVATTFAEPPSPCANVDCF